jgi:hypothetical protein
MEKRLQANFWEFFKSGKDAKSLARLQVVDKWITGKGIASP